MNFIFDEFIQIETDNKKFKIWVSVADISLVYPVLIDTCSVITRYGERIQDIDMPASVLISKINRIRDEKRKEYVRI